LIKKSLILTIQPIQSEQSDNPEEIVVSGDQSIDSSNATVPPSEEKESNDSQTEEESPDELDNIDMSAVHCDLQKLLLFEDIKDLQLQLLYPGRECNEYCKK
jgi:hypothetical protein